MPPPAFQRGLRVRYVLFFSLLLNGALAVLLFLFWREKKSLIQQTRQIRRAGDSHLNYRLTTDTPGSAELIHELNGLLDKLRSGVMDMEKRERSLKEQMIGISHDLRTPLTSVRGYLELLEEAGEEEKDRCLEVIRTRSEHLQRMIEHFYDLSKLEDPGFSLELNPGDPAPLLEAVLLSYYPNFEQSGIELKVNIERGHFFRIENEALLRVYGNFIQNIMRYAEGGAEVFHGVREGKTVTIFSNRIKAGESPRPELLFTRFYNGDASRHAGSSGLGLYTAKLLLNKMGHEAAAQTENGRISFTITYAGEFNA